MWYLKNLATSQVQGYLKFCMNCENASVLSASGTMTLITDLVMSIISFFTFMSGPKGRKRVTCLYSIRSAFLKKSSQCVPLSLSVRQQPKEKSLEQNQVMSKFKFNRNTDFTWTRIENITPDCSDFIYLCKYLLLRTARNNYSWEKKVYKRIFFLMWYIIQSTK